MIDRVASPADEQLERIVAAIAAHVSAARIILFGSRARGEARADSDYDFIIELVFDETERWKLTGELSRAVRDVASGTPVDLILRHPGELEARGDDPGYMDWDIVREGVIVFPPQAAGPMIRLRRSGGRAKESNPHESVAEWLALAEQDRRTAEITLASGSNAAWMAVCFHSQQLAEKYLKVLLVETNDRPPHTHNLSELVARAHVLGHSLGDLDASCKILNPFAVVVRYPTGVPIPSESTARDACAAARQIVDAVEMARHIAHR